MELSITLLEKMTADVVSLAKVPDIDLQSAAEWLYSFDVQNSEGALRQRSMAYFSVVGYTCVLVHLPKLR